MSTTSPHLPPALHSLIERIARLRARLVDQREILGPAFDLAAKPACEAIDAAASAWAAWTPAYGGVAQLVLKIADAIEAVDLLEATLK